MEELSRDGLVTHRVARRANALVLLDRGWNYQEVADALLLDDDTIRTWRTLYEQEGTNGLINFDYAGSQCNLNIEQQEKLKLWVMETLPRSTRQVGEWIEQEFGISYAGRSGLIALLHRLGMDYRKPKAVSSKLDVERQKTFINFYNKLLKNLDDDESVLFCDAVHPTHAVRPVGCWAPKDTPVMVEQNSGRSRLNIHGAIDLETGRNCILETETVNAASTIELLNSIENLYPNKRKIHLFLDNARYHHAVMVRDWLARPECRIVMHFIPAYCPHLNPIERLWGLMHRNVTHNKCYAKFKDFCDATLQFLRNQVPKNWHTYCDQVSDNFRIINPLNFRIL